VEGAWNADGKGRSIWDDFSQTPGITWLNTTGDVAIEHYYRFKQDVALMKSLGVKHYRCALAAAGQSGADCMGLAACPAHRRPQQLRCGHRS
jgi:hypothetical protein